MFRRWAEARMYRRTMQIAVSELRRAARTANAIEKLEALDMAERKLRDAQWLMPSTASERFDEGMTEIVRSREQTLDQAIPAVERLLEAMDQKVAEPDELRRAAVRLLSFLNHYRPEDSRVDDLNGWFLRLGGEPQTYASLLPLSEIYHRPQAPAAGCGAVLMLFLLGLGLMISLSSS